MFSHKESGDRLLPPWAQWLASLQFWLAVPACCLLAAKWLPQHRASPPPSRWEEGGKTAPTVFVFSFLLFGPESFQNPKSSQKPSVYVSMARNGPPGHPMAKEAVTGCLSLAMGKAVGQKGQECDLGTNRQCLPQARHPQRFQPPPVVSLALSSPMKGTQSLQQ